MRKLGTVMSHLVNTTPMVKYGHVESWGGDVFFSNRNRRLIGIVGKMNAGKYMHIQDENLFQSTSDHRLGQQTVFQQDNDPGYHRCGFRTTVDVPE